MFDYREELEAAIDWQRENLPDAVAEAIESATANLYYGPSHGRWLSALEVIRDWADSVESVTLYDFMMGDDDEEVEYEAGQIDAGDIVCAIVGRELYSYL